MKMSLGKIGTEKEAIKIKNMLEKQIPDKIWNIGNGNLSKNQAKRKRRKRK